MMWRSGSTISASVLSASLQHFYSESLSCLLTRVGEFIYIANKRVCAKSLGADGRKRVMSKYGTRRSL